MSEHERSPRVVKKVVASDSSLWHWLGTRVLAVAGFLAPWFFLPVVVTAPDASRLTMVAILATVGFIALLADTIERRRLVYPRSWVSLGVLLVVIAGAVSTFFSVAPTLSLFGSLILPDSLAHLLVAAVIFVLSAVFLTERTDYTRVFIGVIAGSAFACLLTLLGAFGVPYLSLFAPLTLAGSGFLSVLLLGVIGLLPVRTYSTRAQVFFYVAAALAFILLVVMNYTMLWTALAIIALLTATFGFARKTSIAVPLALALVSLAFIVIGGRLPAIVTPAVEVRPDTVSTFQTAGAQLSSWRAVFGSGPSTFGSVFAEHRPQSLTDSSFWDARFDQGVSYLATMPTTLGIVGSLAWLLVIAGALLVLRQRPQGLPGEILSLIVIFGGLAVLGYTGSFTTLVVTAMALGTLVGLTSMRGTFSFSGVPSWSQVVVFLLLIIATAAILSGTYLLGQKYVASQYFAQGMQTVSAGDTEKGVAALSTAVAYDPASDRYHRSLSQALLLRFQELSAASSSDPQAMQMTFTSAVQSAKAAIAANPVDSVNWGNLGAIYEGLTPLVAGMDTEALTAYTEASTRDPRNPGWPLARARVYAALADFQKQQGGTVQPEVYTQAQNEITQALAIKPNFTEAHFLSAQYFFMAGATDAAFTKIEAIRALAPADPELQFQIGLLLYQNNQLDGARDAFMRTLALNSGSANAHYFLGLTLSRLGATTEARQEFAWIAERNPENEEVKRILANLDAGRPVLEGIVVDTNTTTSSSSTVPTP